MSSFKASRWVVVSVLATSIGGAFAAEKKATADLFTAMDANADGSVSKDELEAFNKAHPGKLPSAPPLGRAARSGFGGPPPEPEPEKPTGDVFADTAGKYLTIHKSFLSGVPKDKLDPAKFSWSAPKDGKATYTLDLAVQGKNNFHFFGPPVYDLNGYHLEPTWNLIFESHVTTAASGGKNQLLYQGLIQFDLTSPEDSFVQSQHLFIRPGYETDRHNDTQQKRLDIDYQPLLDLPGWGQTTALKDFFRRSARTRTLDPNEWSFAFFPFIGLELHSMEEGVDQLTKDVNLPGLEDDYGFLRLTLEARLKLSNRFALTASWNHRTELYGNAGSHDYWEVSALFIPDPAGHYSIGATYKRGEDSPKYQDLNLIEAFVGITY